MAAQKKNPAASAPIDAPAPFVAAAQVEDSDPIGEAAAFAEASAAAAPTPVPVESSAPVSTAAAAATAGVVPSEVAKMFEAPAKSMTQMQEKMRSMIEKGIVETRGAYTKARSAADETNSALEASFVTAKTGAVEINAKVLKALRASADANFDFVKSILGVKSIADYVTLHSEFARKQIETLTGQTKDIAALAQKIATESAEPIKTRVAKTFKIAS
jgi:phasin